MRAITSWRNRITKVAQRDPTSFLLLMLTLQLGILALLVGMLYLKLSMGLNAIESEIQLLRMK